MTTCTLSASRSTCVPSSASSGPENPAAETSFSDDFPSHSAVVALLPRSGRSACSALAPPPSLPLTVRLLSQEALCFRARLKCACGREPKEPADWDRGAGTPGRKSSASSPYTRLFSGMKENSLSAPLTRLYFQPAKPAPPAPKIARAAPLPKLATTVPVEARTPPTTEVVPIAPPRIPKPAPTAGAARPPVIASAAPPSTAATATFTLRFFLLARLSASDSAFAARMLRKACEPMTFSQCSKSDGLTPKRMSH
mmetsp:Transcript_66946/g.160328  ORF Transcript_66946/g.160328 Transcript_66946/m.160328 type:complete len:254 (-) Transcript_66946:936-1697(-)